MEVLSSREFYIEVAGSKKVEKLLSITVKGFN